MNTTLIKKSFPHSRTSTLQQTAVIAAALALAFGPGRALAQRPLGVDVSDIQGSGINWSSAKAAGYSFSWAKATEGTGYIASSFVPNENNGKAAGVLMGGYDFARPDLVTPTSEAAYFWAEAGPYVKADGKTLMPMLDMETFNGVVGASSYADWVNQWCNAIVNDAAGQGVAVKPVLYTTTCEAGNLNSSVAQWIPWIANPSGESAQTGTPWDYTPCGSDNWWGGWTVWQYDWNGSVSGIPGVVDRDVFNGNSSGLVATLVATSTSNPHINPCAARTSDGRMEVFAVGKSGNLYHDYQNSPSGSWSGWIAMGTSGNVWPQNCIPSVGVNPDGRLEVFIVGTDGTVNHIWQKVAGSSATTNWSTFGQFSSHISTTAKLAVGNWANGNLDVFAIGTDGVLYHNYVGSSGWTGFQSLGGSWSQGADIAVSKEKDGREEVFVVGSTGNLYNNWQTTINGTTWNGWHDLSGALSQTVRTAVGRNSDGRLEAFTIGTDGVAYHEYETAANGPTAWTGWTSLGGSWETDAKPIVGTDQNGALELFLIGNTGNMYHNYQASGGWSGWISLTGGFTQNIRPCVGMNLNGELELFLTGPGSDMQHAWQTAVNSATWSGWGTLGGSWN
ncbi:MAG: hypothetical protein JWQ04_631 [Pedosphaera sp.]|nr:hypothetical protein [Pedosphaera sp.]